MTTGERRTPQDAARRRALADASGGWIPRRGDLVHDTAQDRSGVVVAVPEDTGSRLYHLRPQGGGNEWAAPLDALRPHSGTAEDGRTLDEAAMPPGGFGHPGAPR